MSGINLYQHQTTALNKMKNGCILCGGVGTGKSRTALAYYYILNGGKISSDKYIPMKSKPMDLYIITTAKKRDDKEWEGDFTPFLINTRRYCTDVIKIDSWNNIQKYKDVKNSFFIFDEQRLVGSGVWVKTFLKIAKNNQWILLSATPGDSWKDYVPVFLANGFYRSRRDFEHEHVIFRPFVSFPQIDRYVGIRKLIALRDEILVDMPIKRHTVRKEVFVDCEYDKYKRKALFKDRINPFTDEPVESPIELVYAERRICNEDDSRQKEILEIHEKHGKCIIFYNFDYELDILRNLCENNNIPYSEWNGHKHEKIPDDLYSWIYLVQYTSGCEGWNCITANTIIFYSLNHSYKVMEQAAGRIDRLNTPYTDLWYYYLKSNCPIDLRINRCRVTKQIFNDRNCYKKLFKQGNI